MEYLELNFQVFLTEKKILRTKVEKNYKEK